MRAALLLTLLRILTGCATTTASVGTDAVACSAFEPIRWSERDTEGTIRQVKEHKAALAAVRFKASTAQPLRPRGWPVM
jgi:hypothetical protein